MPETKEQKRVANEVRVISAVENQKGFVQEVDGYVYFQPPGGGLMSSGTLRVIADHLDRVNEQWNRTVEDEIGTSGEEATGRVPLPRSDMLRTGLMQLKGGMTAEQIDALIQGVVVAERMAHHYRGEVERQVFLLAKALMEMGRWSREDLWMTDLRGDRSLLSKYIPPEK